MQSMLESSKIQSRFLAYFLLNRIETPKDLEIKRVEINFKIKTKLVEANPNAVFSSIKAQMRESLILDAPYAECYQLSKKLACRKFSSLNYTRFIHPLFFSRQYIADFWNWDIFKVGSNNLKNVPGSRIRLFSLFNKGKPT